ncbi:CMP-sialic acid transporter 3 [Acorus gramineus]|uniref:CMP-sialic acid transporter 3 n=1 Tax=Acorus gramineus TaxID=55184 RepID=A0AAV9ART0_ACOGR|nr:CMP-sialic acid transporter 3 [Acorus gramineus]
MDNEKVTHCLDIIANPPPTSNLMESSMSDDSNQNRGMFVQEMTWPLTRLQGQEKEERERHSQPRRYRSETPGPSSHPDLIRTSSSSDSDFESFESLIQDQMRECSVCHSKLVSPTTKAVSRAYDRHRSKVSSKVRALNCLLVVGDCVLVGLQVSLLSFFEQPILVYMSKVDGNFKFSPISVNFLTECTKVLFALLMLFFQARRQKVGEKPLLSISTFVQAARNNVLLAVPALLYAINNYLKFIMQLYFNPSTVKMLSNLKLNIMGIDAS